KLTAEDLKDIGVARVGDRRKFLEAIAALGVGAPPSPVAERPSELPGLAPALSSEAERRQLTVMFCDLVGSTALSARLDPEELHEVIGAYHRCVAGAVRRFDGFVAKYMGDRVLVYFGYPQAHEDDAERAVRAGLGTVEAVGRLDTPVIGKLEVRIGIAPRLVGVGGLVGEGAAQAQGGGGRTPNVGARLQGLGGPGAGVGAARPHVGCSAIGSGCSHSAGTRSRVWPSRWRPGRSRGSRRQRAGSKRCRAEG